MEFGISGRIAEYNNIVMLKNNIMTKYRKKPIEIEAFKFYLEPMPDWFMDKVSSNDVILHNCDYKRFTIEQAYCEIKTSEGVMICNGGDYVIKEPFDKERVLYPCKPEIFKKTYELC